MLAPRDDTTESVHSTKSLSSSTPPTPPVIYALDPFSLPLATRVCSQAIVEEDPVFTNADNMFMSRPERYRHGLRKARRFTVLKEELKLRCVPPPPPSSQL